MILTKEDFKTLRDIRIHKILDIPDNGRRIAIRCPIHQGTNHNFNVYPGNSYHCFKCGANGNGSIDFLKDLGLSLNDTIKELANYL